MSRYNDRETKRCEKLVHNFELYLKEYCSSENPRIQTDNFTILDDTIKVPLRGVDVISDAFREKIKKFSQTKLLQEKNDIGGFSAFALIPFDNQSDDSESDSSDDERSYYGRRRKKKRNKTEIFSTKNIFLAILAILCAWLALNYLFVLLE